jgi:hypothetical protein
MMADAIRPGGGHPDKCRPTDREESAYRIDQRRQPIGNAQPKSAMARKGVAGSIDEQRQPIEHVQQTSQHFGGLVGDQPQRWCPGRQGEQPLHGLVANAAQRQGIGQPRGRRARLSSQLGRNAAQNGFCLLPISVSRQTAQIARNAAPTSQRSEQAVDSALQYRRVVAHVAGFTERFVDHRVERDDTLAELASLGLCLRQLRPRQRQRAGKSARDFGRQIGE